MTLIKCTECGTEFSSNATACVKCGNPNTPSTTTAAPATTRQKVTGTIWAFLMLAGLAAGIKNCSSDKSEPIAAAPQSEQVLIDKAKLAVLAIISITLTGCATYKTTLTDAQGKSVTCEASGHAGIITGSYLKSGFDECVNAAKAQGYTNQAGATPVSPPSPSPSN